MRIIRRTTSEVRVRPYTTNPPRAAALRQRLQESITAIEDEQPKRPASVPLKTVPTGRLYCDLDGVLSDFDRAVRAIFNSPADDVPKNRLWRTLATVGNGTPERGFYNTLQWMPDGQRLWHSIRHLRPTILTGLPMGKWAEPQKRLWCRRQLGHDVPVVTCMAADKHRWCRPGDILIDDSGRLATAWRAAGGTFVLHASLESTLQELRDLGLHL